MLEPMNKETAFASIAADLECFVPLLATTDRAAQLAACRNIGDVLLSANLTWRDVAERLAAPRPAASSVEPAPVRPPPPPPIAAGSAEERFLNRILGDGAGSHAERTAYGYRNAPTPEAEPSAAGEG